MKHRTKMKLPMKPNRMWAMFNEDGTLYALICTVKHTRKQVITLVQNHYGMKWKQLEECYGYRIEKVVVLRESEFETHIKAAEDKRGEEVPELALSKIEDELTGNIASKVDDILKRISLNIRKACQERFGKQPTEPLSWGNIEPKHPRVEE